MRIRLLPEAEHDLEIGADFYESQKAGLGVYFNDCLTSDIDFLDFFAVEPTVEDYAGSHNYEIERNGLRLLLTVCNTRAWSRCPSSAATRMMGCSRSLRTSGPALDS